MRLSLKMFGAFSVRDGSGTAFSLRTRKTRALLAYLAINANKPQPRERLMALLWSDRDEKQARQSLNDALKSIRRIAKDKIPVLLVSDGEQVTLHGEAFESDVARFDALLADEPAEAVKLYDGPFLDGLSIPDPAFEEWLTATRSALDAKACDALQHIADAAAGRGDTKEAIDTARRLVALDPLREDAHRRLMELLHKSGDRAGALRQYQACVDILMTELQVAPDAATCAMFEEIRQDAPTPEPGEALSQGIEHPLAKSEIPTRRTSTRGRLIAAVAACVLLVMGGGAIVWFAPWSQSTKSVPQEYAALRSSDQPSIAVLPFANISGDPKQDYFSDGITEDIITRLARRPDMFVIARMSSFIYKGKSVTAQQVGRDLGVRYLLEGSIQKSADQIRITAQLIEADTGKHIWAESFDRKLQDVFSVQDEIARKVAVELAVKLTEGEMARSQFQATDNVAAYGYFLRGVDAFRRIRKVSNIQAGRLFEEAIKLDPQYALAIAWLGLVRGYEYFLQWSDDPELSLRQAEKMARRAVAIDENSGFGHAVLSRVHVLKREYDQAIVEGQRAIEVEPNNAALYAMFARTSIIAGRLKEAFALVQEMLRLAPNPPVPIYSNVPFIHYLSGRYEEAIATCQKLLARSKKSGSTSACHRRMIGSYMALGREEEARAVARVHMEMKPNFSLEHRADVLRRRHFRDPSWIDVHIERLRRAGLPN